MGRYSLRDGKITLPKASVKHLVIETEDTNEGVYGAPYIKLYSPAKGESPRYLYLGTGGALTISDAEPVGTSGAFSGGTTV